MGESMKKRHIKRSFRRERREEKKEEVVEETWTPKTVLGKKVLNGEITSMDEIFDQGYQIKEPEIVDYLLPNLRVKVMDTRRTTRVTRAGRLYSYRVQVLVGDGERFIGLGSSKSSDRINAIKKATRQAKLNLIRFKRGCGSWECRCGTKHSVPFILEGKAGSVRVRLIPAPRGTGLVIGDKVKPVLEFVGSKDVWSKTFGDTRTTYNYVLATVNALKSMGAYKLSDDFKRVLEE